MRRSGGLAGLPATGAQAAQEPEVDRADLLAGERHDQRDRRRDDGRHHDPRQQERGHLDGGPKPGQAVDQQGGGHRSGEGGGGRPHAPKGPGRTGQDDHDGPQGRPR